MGDVEGTGRPGRRPDLVVVLAAAVLVTIALLLPAAAPLRPARLHPDHYVLSDGCVLNARGVGPCGPLLGGATGSNDDPAGLEQQFGQRYGVRRSYFTAGQEDRALTTAAADLAAGRIPWISFKLPHPWTEMAAGAGDAWAADLSTRLAGLPGPVWVAFHHEPEKDQPDIGAWRATQERLGPILRSRAPNAAFTVILTGWNQFRGPAEFSLASLWPGTTVDLAGFDVYCPVGAGKHADVPASLHDSYLVPLAAWARAHGVAWGLAETGITNAASARHPDWIQRTRQELADTGGLVLAYFNSPLNSTQDWTLGDPGKAADFAAALRQSPVLSSR
jgi:hypothetical protein